MTKEKKIGVSKVVIQIGDKEATLTVEQVKELRDALNALLGPEKIVERWYPRWRYVDGGYTVYGHTSTSANTALLTDTSGESYTITLKGDGDAI